ncbi:MAG: DUF4421 domain-containing protein [Prevotella sp.]|nr:DUF4421 domain-containing protein [Prevotella sp.]
MLRIATIVFVLSLLPVAEVSAQETAEDSLLALPVDSVAPIAADTSAAFLSDSLSQPVRSRGFFRRIADWFAKFNDIDTVYIEPQHYNFAAMLQNTNVFQVSTFRTKSDFEIRLSPDLKTKVGPYFGWRWVFLGYTIDVKNLFRNTDGTYIDISLYSNLFNLDLYYLDTGHDFKIRSNHIHPTHDTSGLNGKKFDGLSVKARGFNLFYVMNHHHFSYPAAYSQSTVQRRSCGSGLLGLGYAHHSINLDMNRIIDMYRLYVPEAQNLESVDIDEELFAANDIHFQTYTLNGGYAYNWVFAKNWLFSISATLGLSYKITDADLQERKGRPFKDFSADYVNIDFNGRMGVVYNNTKWFAGFSAIAHNFNYRSDLFTSYNTYGTFNFYVGFNFW